MATDSDLDSTGLFDARYKTFLETMRQLRPRLHRYCARMTGSVLDGEDIVQEALFEAYRKLDTFDEGRALSPWLFRIAHNRCIDFLRRRGVREEAEAAAAGPVAVSPEEPPILALGPAVERLVVTLPPKERACVLLKDVFDYSLEEISELVGSSVGAVKAALNRGRSKRRATIKVLTTTGFQVVREGDNGFVCLVMRGWSAPTFTPAVQRALIYDATVRAPICFDPPATRMVLPFYELKHKLGMEGKTPDQIADGRQAAYARGQLPRRDTVSFGYMWSADQQLGPGVGHWHPHMMVFAPYYDNAMLGGNDIGVAPVANDDAGTPFTVIVIPVDDKLAIEPQRK